EATAVECRCGKRPEHDQTVHPVEYVWHSDTGGRFIPSRKSITSGDVSECPANRLERAFVLPGENAARQISPFVSAQLAVAERA
ncbi:MAG TPA: hypothetical protein VG253_10760, partial [Streptosporangiaceae bacterium]|nr:hypothetical protein [Streptosporangiaceae bacterium]